MACRTNALIGVLGLLAASSGAAQDMPNPQAMQMQVQQIVQQRPREAEAAARAFLMLVAPERVGGLDSLRDHANAANNQPVLVVDGRPVSNPPAIRNKIEGLITQHFDLEDQLRALEIADIERRLADVRAESQRRREKRSEFIKFAVDDIIRDAIRPR